MQSCCESSCASFGWGFKAYLAKLPSSNLGGQSIDARSHCKHREDYYFHLQTLNAVNGGINQLEVVSMDSLPILPLLTAVLPCWRRSLC